MQVRCTDLLFSVICLICALVALRDNAKPKGWVTAFKEGEQFLALEGGAADGLSASDDGGSMSAQKKAEQAAAKKRSSAKSQGEAVPTYTSADLREMAAKQHAIADDAEAQSSSGTSLSAKLGEVLVQKKVSVADFVRDWSANGVISKMDFRRNIRALGLVDTSSSVEMDQLFESLDSDHGGALDATELRAAFQHMRDAAAASTASGSSAKELIKTLREHAELTMHAAELTESAEAAETASFKAKSKLPVEQRLGLLLAKRNIKVGELVATWDPSGAGEINLECFISNVRALGLDASNDEIASIFANADSDGGGSLDLPELTAFLRVLQEATTHAKEDERTLAKRALDLRKAAKAAQLEAHRARVADDEERERGLEEAKAKAEAEELVKAEARAQAKAKRDARFAKEAEEKAKFEAKIKAKRKEGVSKLTATAQTARVAMRLAMLAGANRHGPSAS